MEAQIKLGDIIEFEFTSYGFREKIISNEEREVLSIITDPLGRRENKYVVEINNERYGIEHSEIINVTTKEPTLFN